MGLFWSQCLASGGAGKSEPAEQEVQRLIARLTASMTQTLSIAATTPER